MFFSGLSLWFCWENVSLTFPTLERSCIRRGAWGAVEYHPIVNGSWKCLPQSEFEVSLKYYLYISTGKMSSSSSDVQVPDPPPSVPSRWRGPRIQVEG